MQKTHFVKIGDTFDKLTVLSKEILHRGGCNRRYWNCRCECGGTIRKREDAFFGRKHQSCGCDTASIQAFNTGRIKWRGIGNLSKSYFTQCRRSAKIRHIKFDITIEDAWKQFEKQKGICSISGCPIKLLRTIRTSEQTASLDRIDSAKGYSKNNIQWVHKTVNIMKNTAAQLEFIHWCKKIAFFNTRGETKGKSQSNWA